MILGIAHWLDAAEALVEAVIADTGLLVYVGVFGITLLITLVFMTFSDER